MKQEKTAISFDPGTISGVLFTANSNPTADAPSMIICHGAFEYKEKFFELAEALGNAGVHSMVIDMPGHGESSGERFHINIDQSVRAIQKSVDWLSRQPEINSERIGAFGFSSGGTAVFEAALAEPRLKSLVTLDATVKNYLGPIDTLTFKILNAVGILKKKISGTDLHLKLLHILKSVKVAHDPEINRAIISDPQIIEAYSAFPLPGAAPCAFVDTIKRIHKISVPTLVMHGEEDHVDPPKTAEMIFNTLTCEKTLEFLPDSGHCGHLDTQKHKMMQMTADWALKHL